MARRFWTLLIVAGALIVSAGIFASVHQKSNSTRPLIVTAEVGRRTIQNQLTLSGTIGRLVERTITAGTAAEVSDVSVSDGQMVSAGQPIVGVDGREMIAEPGSIPFYRQLGVGDQGPDVAQLNDILTGDGYQAGTGSVFTSQTAAALAEWQTAKGYPGVGADKPETLTAALQPGSGYSLGDQSSAGLVIGAATDSAEVSAHRPVVLASAVRSAGTVPTLTIYALDQVTAKGSPATFVVYASQASAKALTFSVSEGGDAPADEVLPPTGPFVLPAGATSVDVEAPTRANGLVEPDAQVSLSLDAAAGYVVGDPGSAETTIKSTDLPQLSLSGGGSVAAGGRASFTVTADQAPVQAISVVLEMAGTAQPGVDYEPLASAVTLPAGQTSVSVTVQTINRNVEFLPTDMLTGDWPTRVGVVSVKAGDEVAPGDTLFTLTDPNFTVTLQATPSERSQLAVGQSATVQLQGGSTEANGVISELDNFPTVSSSSPASAAAGGSASSGSETYQGKIQVGDLDAADGSTVTITVNVQDADQVLAVPIAAVEQNGSGQDVVRVIDLDHGGRVTDVPVVTGLADSSYIEIKSGLQAGEVVIVDTTTISG